MSIISRIRFMMILFWLGKDKDFCVRDALKGRP
jgi:hypothetical protein